MRFNKMLSTWFWVNNSRPQSGKFKNWCRVIRALSWSKSHYFLLFFSIIYSALWCGVTSQKDISSVFCQFIRGFSTCCKFCSESCTKNRELTFWVAANFKQLIGDFLSCGKERFIGGFPIEIKTNIRYCIICCHHNFTLWNYDINKLYDILFWF